MILHVDMDAFYASVEERDRPELVGRPLIVGGTPEGRGVVAAANYVVRKFGVTSAMATSTALRLCPNAIVLPPRMDYYARISEQIREIFFRYTPLVEPLSLDEAFLDVTGSEGLFGSAVDIARRIKHEVRYEVGLVASIGVAPNKFLAKIASDLEKPDGLVVVEPQEVQLFLDPLPVWWLWGVGRVTGEVLEQMRIRTIADLRSSPLETLRDRFGVQGERFWKLARGIDERRVIPDREAKSISQETTFPQDIHELATLQAWLQELAEHVGRRLRRHCLFGRIINLKLRFPDFRTIHRSKALACPTNITSEIGQTADQLLQTSLPRNAKVRLLGVGVTRLSSSQPRQQLLFDDDQQDRHKKTRLDAVTDQIQQKFGSTALKRADGLLHNAHHRPAPRPEPY